MRITTLVLVYILYPEILRKSFSLMNCIELDDHSGLKALSLSPNLECWNQRHTLWVLAVSIPGLLFWGIMIPAIILRALIYYKKNIHFIMGLNEGISKFSANQEISSRDKTNSLKKIVTSSKKSVIPLSKSPRHSDFYDTKKESPPELQNNAAIKIVLNFGFFFRGYRKECYYWEILMFSRKFLLIFIGVFSEFFPKNSKASVFLLIINFYMYFQLKYKPFKYDYLNRLEILSLFVCFFTGVVGTLLFSEDVKKAAVFFVLLVVGINLGYICFWVHQLFTQAIGKEQSLQLLHKLSGYIRGLLRRIFKYKKT